MVNYFFNYKAGALVEVKVGDELHPFSPSHYLRHFHRIQHWYVGKSVGLGSRDI